MKHHSIFLFLIGALFFTGCSQQNVDEIESVRKLYKAKSPAEPGDWLFSHDESYVDIDDYKRSKPIRPDEKRKLIYIYTLGDFTKAEDSLLAITCAYLETVYHLKTKMAVKFPFSIVPEKMQRTFGDTIPQICTKFILDTLVKIKNDDAIVSICLTKYDLYPSEDWNFVFGQAYLKDRAGVWSFNRYGNPNDPKQFSRVLMRTMKVATHETGHMFSIKHCIRYECDMNGSNSLDETDLSPLSFCPDCLEKLKWNLNFNLKSHFENLQSFYKKYNLPEEVIFMQTNLDHLNK